MLTESDINSSKVKQAIADIVTYNTLPQQIDYRKPYKIKANKAEEFIKTLPDADKIFKIIGKKIDAYHSSDAAAHNDLF